MVSRTWQIVEAIHRTDVPHRSGVKPSDNPHGVQLMKALRDEVDELDEALAIDAFSPFLKKSRQNALHEIGDLLVMVYRIGQTMGFTAEEIDEAGERKAIERFPGVKEFLTIA